MAIIVQPAYREFSLFIEHESEKVEFVFKQLSYKQKSQINAAVTKVEKGQFSIDANLQVFLNIKYGLKKVLGLVNEDGTVYEVQYEDKQKTVLTDECVDQLLGTPLTDSLQYAANALTAATIPTEILHPLTKEKLEGIEVVIKSNKALEKK